MIHLKHILKENNKSYELAATINNTIDDLQGLSGAQKKDFKFNAMIYQVATPIEEKLNSIYKNALPAQKATIETILLTYKEQKDLSTIINNQNKELLNKIELIEKQKNKLMLLKLLTNTLKI